MHPILLHAGHLVLPTFGVLAAVGLIAGLLLSERTARLVGLDAETIWNAGLFAVIAAFVVSRGLLVAENFRSFVAAPLLLLAVPSLTAGGLLLTVVATCLWLHWRGVPLLAALDAWAPCATLVWAFLAVGHWAEGSDPGLPVRAGSDALRPVALYAAAVALVLTVALYARLRGLTSYRPGETAGFGLIGAGAAQFLLSFLRQPGVVIPYAAAGLDMLQWVALAMMLAGTVLVVLSEAERASVA